MDVFGVNVKSTKSKKLSSKKSGRRKDIKVVYISSPMKVKANASEFRALVQELTGKDSDIAQCFMDVGDGHVAGNESFSPEVGDRRVPAADHDYNHHHHHHHELQVSSNWLNYSSQNEPSSSLSSDSALDPFDELMVPMEGSFLNMLESNYFHGVSHELDVLN